MNVPAWPRWQRRDALPDEKWIVCVRARERESALAGVNRLIITPSLPPPTERVSSVDGGSNGKKKKRGEKKRKRAREERRKLEEEPQTPRRERQRKMWAVYF